MSGVGGRRRSGFTLIELLLVIIILAAIAGAAVATLDTATGDARIRDEDTRNRLERIRTAILGPEGATAPQGFVADVGRLPVSIRELVAPVAVPAGWRGPYFRTLPNPITGLPDFPDGWGSSTVDDNFGWNLPAPITSGDFPLQSLGSDHAIGQTPPGDTTAADFPIAASPLISVEDYTIPIAGRFITVTLVASAPSEISKHVLSCRLHFKGPSNEDWMAYGEPTSNDPLVAGSNVVTFEFYATVDATNRYVERVAIGRHRLEVRIDPPVATGNIRSFEAELDITARTPLPQVRTSRVAEVTP